VAQNSPSSWTPSSIAGTSEPRGVARTCISNDAYNDPPRWCEPDWRKTHPEAYKILLLELGIGLRREESDKSQWDWFFTGHDGRRYIEVKKTEYFTPKGKRRRIIPVEPVLWTAIQEGRQDVTPFIVPENMPIIYTRKTAPKNIAYRCERHHRTLVAWLRKKGITDRKPCHLLRKEFGSYVATSFGLFVAQRLLGHSSPAVTDAFYAGLTNLPELRHAQPQQRTRPATNACEAVLPAA
jgi:integrase